MRLPELLAPAGSPEALDAAIAEGADAVYLGLKTFNARLRSSNFSFSQFEGVLKTLHRRGKKVYVTVNTVFEQREADRIYQLIKYLASLGPDGIIVQDFGVLMMARGFPSLRVHASTQMNIASARGANALSKYGVSRVVLARELTLGEIASIRENTNLELEVFVHGALCASVSGLCLFSSYLGGKSANRGLCTQACRRLYTADSPEGESAYYFSPRDLSLIARIPELTEAGVRSFKIEGRMKSAEYVGAVVSAYRLVIDSLDEGEEARRRALESAELILRNDFARPKTEFFIGLGYPPGGISGAPQPAEGSWFRPDQDGGTGISLGTLLRAQGAGPERRGLVRTGIALAAGDSIRLHRSDDSKRQTLRLSFCEPAGTNGEYRISIPEDFDSGDSVYLIQTRTMTKRYPQIVPRDLSACKRFPGREQAPRPVFPAGKYGRDGRGTKALPEGIYAAAGALEDLYVFQSERPAGVILPLYRDALRRLLSGEPLPFKPGEMILSLDPAFYQDADPFLVEALPALWDRGYETFMVNNPGYFSFFPQFSGGEKKPVIIAGPWLYTFNAWAAEWAASQGAGYFVTPLENNRQNLEKTWSPQTVPAGLLPRVFITLFIEPPLFRIRGGIGSRRFTGFEDQREEAFSLVRGQEETLVVPRRPFSIIDKRPFLEQAGFRRFILDFSAGSFSGRPPLKKKFYKDLIKAAKNAQPLPGTVRFNWKNGFYTEKEKNSSSVKNIPSG